MTGTHIGILIFDGVEEMDFVGPWEVLKAAAENDPDSDVFTVAPSLAPVTCEKEMIVLPDRSFEDVPALDVLVIPGGSGARREMDNPKTVDWIQAVAPGCAWVTSVCTGAFLLVGAGPGRGRRVTTHHAFIDMLTDLGLADVVSGERFVRDGNVVSAAGVMSGIEMSLWLSEQVFGAAAAAFARDEIAYDIPPRDSASLEM